MHSGGNSLTEPGTTIIRAEGREIRVRSMRVGTHELVITGSFLRIVQLRDEWYQQIDDASDLVRHVVQRPPAADVLTFIELPPRQFRIGGWHQEKDNVAAIALTDYRSWWDSQVDKTVRTKVRKAEKKGVCVRPGALDDRLLRGIEQIYDETPIRQGKPFWHYRKGIDYLRRVHETYLDRCDFLCAYRGDELVGFVKLVYSGEFARTMHIIAKLSHRDCAVANALVAKAVERSCERGMRWLVYGQYEYEVGGSSSLLQFKQGNGFRKLEFPRYYVPLSAWGRAAIRLNLHRGIVPLLPKGLVRRLLASRQQWYRLRYRAFFPGSARPEA